MPTDLIVMLGISVFMGILWFVLYNLLYGKDYLHKGYFLFTLKEIVDDDFSPIAGSLMAMIAWPMYIFILVTSLIMIPLEMFYNKVIRPIDNKIKNKIKERN